ncbi:hypothetical protein IWX46DRAFT_654581 [Phyllosticta citricarpa]|uniref:Cytochrome P450 n=1 Tax=Phyllosticta citricarpa TaxID=55181 RepID=A0ABR1MUT7_9PEZI
MKIDKDPFIYTPAHLPHRIPPRVGSATRRTLGPEAGGTAPGKGARSCIGHELAKRWLCVLCANLFRRLPSPELFDTTRRDVEPAFELFGPVPWEGSRGLRVKIRDVD